MLRRCIRRQQGVSTLEAAGNQAGTAGDAYRLASNGPTTFCTELARAGVPVNVIKELAGHKSIETTLRYMHSDRAAKREAIEALRSHASTSAEHKQS